MKILDVKQGSPEWHAARLGIPTSSQFGRILTPGGKASEQAYKYILDLVSEWLSGEPADDYEGYWMRRGRELETDSVALYEAWRDVDTKAVGVILNDQCTAGASPDRLVGDGGLEIKCPKANTHVSYLLGEQLPNIYVPQVQGNMLLTGATWWDFMSYHPSMPPLILRIERDRDYIHILAAALETFTGLLNKRKDQLLAKGYLPYSPPTADLQKVGNHQPKEESS